MSQLDPAKYYSKDDLNKLAGAGVDVESLSESLDTLRSLPSQAKSKIVLLAENYAVLSENESEWPKDSETKTWLQTLSSQARQTSNKNSFASIAAGPGNEDDTGSDLVVWLGKGPSYGGKEDERKNVSQWIIESLGLKSNDNEIVFLSGTETHPVHSLSMLSMFPDAAGAVSKGITALNELSPKPLLEFRLGSSGKIACIAGGIRKGQEEGWVVLVGMGVFT